MSKRFLPAIAITAGLAIAGCGGSSSPTTTPANTTTTSTVSGQSAKQQFANQLSDLCRQANNRFQSASTPVARAAVVERFVARVGALKPPPELNHAFSNYVTVIQRELADLKGGNTSGLYALAHSKAKPLVQAMGATGCVTGS